MKVKVHADKCVASAQCSALVPQVFSYREEDGKVLLLKETAEPELREAVREAGILCPAAAIEIVES
jgi:ferredoxin